MGVAQRDTGRTEAQAVTIDELLIADDPERWSELGFTVEGDCCVLGGVRLVFAQAGPGRGIVGWSLRGVASTELDGLATTLSRRPPLLAASEHANGVGSIDHLVVSSPALDRSVRALQQVGLDLRRVREEPTATGAPRQAFFRLGEVILEVVQEPAEIVERRPDGDGAARFWGLALCADDLERTVERLGEHVGPAKAAVQPGRSIATVRRSAGLAVPLALMSAPAGAVR